MFNFNSTQPNSTQTEACLESSGDVVYTVVFTSGLYKRVVGYVDTVWNEVITSRITTSHSGGNCPAHYIDAIEHSL